MELILNWVAILFLLGAIVHSWIARYQDKLRIELLNDTLVKNHGYLSGEISRLKRMCDPSRYGYGIYLNNGETAKTVPNIEELRWDKLRSILDKNEVQDLCDEVNLLRKKLELLEEIQTHLSPKKPEKQEPKKRDQKEKAVKLISEALEQSPLSFSEIVDFLDQKKISLKKSTISVYLSNDERFESKDGKWQIKKLDESPSVS